MNYLDFVDNIGIKGSAESTLRTKPLTKKELEEFADEFESLMDVKGGDVEDDIEDIIEIEEEIEELKEDIIELKQDKYSKIKKVLKKLDNLN